MENKVDQGCYERPHLIAPSDWSSNGVDYGAYCKCGRCGLIERSTISFDYYATDGPGSSLLCETCRFGTPLSALKPVIDMLEEEGAFEEPGK